MRPHIIMHMGTSIDGRIVPASWPKSENGALAYIYERAHRRLTADAWIVGRITMAEFARGEPVPVSTSETFPRTSWRAPGAGHGPYAVALDQAGKLHLNTSTANKDPIVVILTEAVSDAHLAELRRDHISYIFAGETAIDLPLAMDRLATEFAIARLLLEGGGTINGAFLAADLIDEISLLIFPIADGTAGTPALFDRSAAPAQQLSLRSVDQLQAGVLHLRYDVVR